uniref:Uncharacterized protein n=1 Tax=Quercus lobata TaxID=97700 RepID=A0A7N2MIT6_QUELO
MDDLSVNRDFARIESSGSDVSADPFADESDLYSQSSDDIEAPFARHSPLLEVDLDSIHMQRLFWTQSALEGPWSFDGALLVLEKWRPNLDHPSHVTVDPEPPLAPVPTLNQSNSASPTSQPSPLHQDIEHASLHTTILSLSINKATVPPTLTNSPISSPEDPHNPNPNQNLHVNGAGPFMMNGELREVTRSSLATESDFEMVVMFNLDRLNKDRPKWLHGTAWEMGQIPESTDGLISSLVNRKDRVRLRAVVGNVRHGPSINSASGSAQYQSPNQHMHGLQTTANPVQLVSLDTGLDAIRNLDASDTASSHSSSTSVRTDPGFLGCLQCDSELRGKCGPTRKRIGTELDPEKQRWQMLQHKAAVSGRGLSLNFATARSRRHCRYGIVYEALTLQGDKVFFGVASITARTSSEALLEAVIEAGLAAK